MTGPRVYGFGLFEFDAASGELRRAGRPIRLAPQPGRVLALLLERHGRLVTRDELRRQVWGDDTFVDFDQGLNFCIRQIREALGDEAGHPRYVATIPRHGYRWIAPVERISPDQSPPLAEPVLQRSPRRHWIGPSVVAGLLIAGGSAYVLGTRTTSEGVGPSSKAMIAVMPFEDLDGTVGDNHFGDGFTQELISQLGRFDPDRLGVIARTSTSALRSTGKTAADIGRELRVQHLVEGTVRRSTNRVRISAQLIRTADQAHVWADTFEGDPRDILVLQHQLGSAIAQQILIRLRATGAVEPRPVDPTVYDLYLRARFLWDKRTKPEVRSALASFQDAVDRDPTFAPAYAGIADCYVNLGDFQAALVATAKALSLDENLLEARVTRAHALMHQLDWARAEAEFGRAIAVDPHTPAGRYLHAEYLVARGRYGEAVDEAREAVALDPLSAITNHVVGVTLYFSGDYDGALEYFTRALELDPEHRFSHGRMALVYERQGDYENAFTEFDRAGAPIRAAYAYAMAHRPDEARRRIEEVLTRAEPAPELEAYFLAAAYVGLEEPDRALEWLKLAVRQRVYDVIYLAVDPRLDSLRARPEFQALLQEGGWPVLMTSVRTP